MKTVAGLKIRWAFARGGSSPPARTITWPDRREHCSRVATQRLTLNMTAIENFLAQYPATISMTASAATVAAVIVALYLARRQSRSRLRVFADIKLYVSSEAQIATPVLELENAPQIIMVTISNVGQVAVSIPYWSSFVWSVPGGKRMAAQNPKEPDFRHQPIELFPGKSASIVLSDDLPGYQAMMKELANASRIGPWSIHFPRLTIMTEIGDRFRAKIGKSLLQLARDK